MKNVKSRLGLAVLALIITTAVVAGISSAQDSESPLKFGRFGFGRKEINPDPEKIEQMQERQAQMQGQQEQMQRIFENNDYTAWEALMQERLTAMQERVNVFAESINQETFDATVEIRALMQEGKYEEARALREELDIEGLGEFGCPGFKGLGFKGMGRGMHIPSEQPQPSQ
ncbi:hypothetical protein KKD19_05825 [Patescibacteria group bacterium]|nr:hypothetical protein [Patescibacteria group bacterium]MBU4512722.1 hypothetical protein [Patescibacteria group bacterium]MCG2693659.1 hypothetical protein [Candidatus Parcubacteria bacterium]